MRIFKNNWFERFCRSQKISDDVLIDAIERAEKGLVDADLGGNVIKQRIARSSRGKSGGYRSIILIRKNDKAFFVYGFAKKDRDNLKKNEVKIYKDLAKLLLSFSDDDIKASIKTGKIIEVKK